jgi:hypothetical protein
MWEETERQRETERDRERERERERTNKTLLSFSDFFTAETSHRWDNRKKSENKR